MLGSKNLQGSLVNCSRSCAANAGCSVFVYCEVGGGPCLDTFPENLPEQGCELVLQSTAESNRTTPMMVSQQPSASTLISGAPIVCQEIEKAPLLPGYLQLFAQGFYNLYDYECAGTLTNGSCSIRGSPDTVHSICDEDPRCGLMVWFPQGRLPDLGPNITFLKGTIGVGVGVDPGDSNLNHRAVSYLKLGKSLYSEINNGNSSGLSNGAVAGIAIGSAIAAVAIAAAIFVGSRTILKRKNRASAPHDASKSVIADLETGSKSASGAVNVIPPKVTPVVTYVKGRSSLDSPFLLSTPVTTIGDTHVRIHRGTPSSVVSFIENSERDPESSSGKQEVKNVDLPAEQPRLDVTLQPADTASVLEGIKAANWKHYAVDYDSIQFMRRPDGQLWELGHGAYSRVYKVVLDGTQVLAAKVIPLEDKRAQQVFLREVTTLFHLRHANIVQFSSVCIHNKQGLLLMELMEGGSLFDCMELTSSDGKRVVGWYTQGRRIMLGTVQALHFLHSMHMIHMDLKSANVLLTRDLTPKLADVGFTRVWASLNMSTIDSRVGTFNYMAPELLLSGSVTASTDIYSFGVLLREVCTGEFPSRGRNRMPKVPEECPQEVLDLILLCLKNEPSERPTSKEVYFMLSKCPC